MAGGSLSGRELTREHGEGASPGPTTWLVCVCAPWFRLMAASFAVSKAFARTSKASTVMPPISELTTWYGEVGQASDANVLWVVSPQSTDGRRCPQKHWTSAKTTRFMNRTSLFHSFEPPKTKRSSIMTAEAVRLAKKHPNPVAAE